jgi:putative membrane protein
MFEIQSSQLAAAQAQGAGVKAFASQMVTDHTKTSSDLKPLAQQANVPIPSALDSSHQSMLDKLRSLKGEDFTKQYLDDQVSAHKAAVSLFKRYGNGGDNQQIKSWASSTLPTLQHHLDMAQKLYKKT